MPVKPKESASMYSTMPRAVDVLNVIRSQASANYQERVPVATQDNIEEVGNPILSFQGIKNEFISSLVNRIAMVLITNKLYNNPLKNFKKGLLSLGETVEEVFVNIIKAEPYYRVDDEGKSACQDLFEQRLPDVRAVFHTRNRQSKYVATVSNDDLRTAFLSYQGIEDLVSKIITALYTSDEYDEFILMKHVIFEAGVRGAIHTITIPDPTVSQDNAKKAIIELRAASSDVTFMSTAYNYMGVATHTPTEDQVIFILSRFNAVTDVEVLASAFNMDKTDFIGRRVIVDDFGGLEKEGLVALLVDRDWFMVFDNYLSMTEVYNAARLYWNYFLHHWQTLSYSPFQTCVGFVTTEPTITGVTVTPTTASLTKAAGGTIQFTPTVNGTGLYNGAVTWSIEATDGTATISPTGELTVKAGTTLSSIVVTVTSVADSTKNTTATVTLT